MLKCFYHPQKDAIAGCVNCHHLICESCRIMKNGKSYCPHCFALLYKNQKADNIENPEETKLMLKRLLKRFSNKTK